MRIGEGRRSLGKTDVPNLHAYNECEHPVLYFALLPLLREKLVQYLDTKMETLEKYE